MPDRNEGEFEFTLGNKQLFSVLFIVVVLLGLFFAMGFLAGRGTAPDGSKQIAKRETGPLRVDAGEQQQAAAAQQETPKAAATPAAQPAQAKPEPQKAEPAKAEPARPASAPAGGGVTDTPPAGRYLQVAATVLNDAQTLRLQLVERRLRVIIAPSSKPEYMRVLVGPLGDNDAITAAREELKQVGINSPYLVTYK
jgi:cell division septation protein DedD